MYILVADDHVFNLTIAQKFITHSFANTVVDTCDDGEKAVEQSLLKKYDLILMDIQMPNMDGETATKAIRANAQNPNQQTPILALTASVSEADKEECLKVGMNDFLAKPFELPTLIKKVRHYAQIG